jgi:alpha-beta hydrolase superfamily lysophospholipase
VNTGASSKDPRRHDIADSVAELRGFLEQAELSPPYVLVGHSLGGLIFP